MKRITVSLFVPALFALAACSSSSGSGGGTGGAPPGTGGNNPPTTGGSGNGGGSGGDNGGGGGGDNTPTTTEYDAALTGAAEMPTVTTSAKGAAKFILQQDGVTLAYDLTHNVAQATAVALHIGYPGESGAVIHPLSNVSGHMTGNVTLTADEATSLASGQIYVEIQSSANPSGELRGSLVPPGSTIYVAQLTGAQVVPPVTTQNQGHAAFILNANRDTVRYHFATTATPTDVHINRAIGSLNGPVAFPLAQVAPTVDGTIQLSANDATDLDEARWYVSVVTAAFGTGELRGQVIKEGEMLATALLAGNNEVPPVTTQATGGGQFIVSPDRAMVRYEVIVNGIIPTGARVDNAPRGMNGSLLYSLTLNATGAKGTQTITAADLSALGATNLAVNVATASNVNGELRGQLVGR